MDQLWVLVDGTNNVYRDFHAAGDVEGRLFRQRISAVAEQWNPARIVVAFDVGKSFRHKLFDGYKAGRSRPDGIDAALDAARHACILEVVDSIEVIDYEADDLIATMQDQALEAGDRAVIISADKDLHQLIRAGKVTQAITCRRQQGKLQCDWLTAESLYEKYAVHPEQWVDYRILIGDKSDGIAGIDGIGPVAAKQLLGDCGSIDAFYKNPFKARVSSVIQTKLMNARDQVPGLRELLTLRYDVPLPEGW